jgi:predicted dehydrogenase
MAIIMSSYTRREMIKRAATGVGGAVLFGSTTASARSYAQIRGSNEAVRMGIIGVRGHGRLHINRFAGMAESEGVRIVALCDVDRDVLAREVAALAQRGVQVKSYVDMRAMLDDPEVDAVSVTTPNHWHALATVWACQAGKDVCVEKPVSHCVWEGRKMVEAARRYDRVVQADFDSRSSPALQQIAEFLQAGELGRIQYVRAFNYKRRQSIGQATGPQPIPASVDYNLWTGPAPMRPLLRPNLHYDWHWVWATGNGEIGNNGPHQLDIVRWFLGKQTLPTTVVSLGGRFGYIDSGETPNTQIAVYDYDGIPVVYEARGLGRSRGNDQVDGFTGVTTTGKRIDHEYTGNDAHNNVAVFCEHGYVFGRVAYDNEGKPVRTFEAQGIDPKAHFVRAVRSRKLEDTRIDILEGHISTAFCHLGNISYMLGQQLSRQEVREQVVGDHHIDGAFGRFEDHLRLNGVDLGTEGLVIGPLLHFDSQTERFTGSLSELANEFLKDTYREPFVIPDRV